MHFLSDAHRLREAIISERREDRAKAGATTTAKPVAAKRVRRSFAFLPPIFRFPAAAACAETK